jgi:predicted dinucleotide-binding enzyme
MSEIAIFGAGRVGTALARTALRAGHGVSLVGAAPMEDTRLVAGIVAPGAAVRAPAEAASLADISVVAIPLHKYRAVDPAWFDGRVVVDAMNYWRPVNGVLQEFEDVASSAVIAQRLVGAHVVKTLNHIGYHELETDGLQAGDPHRRALGVAGDGADASAVVAAFVDSLGYDPVVFGPLGASAVLEPDSAIFSGRFDAMQMRDQLALSSIHPTTSTDRTPSWN